MNLHQTPRLQRVIKSEIFQFVVVSDAPLPNCIGYPILSGLALACSQVANGHLVSPLATEQRAGVAKLATGVSRSVLKVRSSEYLGITYQKDIKDIPPKHALVMFGKFV